MTKHEDKYLEDFGIEIPANHPNPAGYKVLVVPYGGPDKTDTGIWLPDETKDAQKYASLVGYVVAMGPNVFEDPKFGGKRWYEVGDWVMVGKFAGNRFMYKGIEMRLLNDDEIIATVENPNEVKRFSI